MSMEYMLVDSFGSTLDVFENLQDARVAIVASLQEDPEEADQLLVLAYANGERVGSPIAALNFVARSKSYFAQVIAAQLSDWTPEINLTLSDLSVGDAVEIELESEETEPDPELLLQEQRFAVC